MHVHRYLIGFAETLVEQGATLVSDEFDLRIIAFGTLIILFALCMVGVDWVIKVQLGLLAVLVVSISSFIIGCFLEPSEDSDPAFMGMFGDTVRNTNVSAVGFTNDDVPALVEGTLPQHRVTKLSPRPAGEEELTALFLDAMTAW